MQEREVRRSNEQAPGYSCLVVDSLTLVSPLASRGVWNRQGQWLPLPYVDTLAAEKLFAHKIFRLLKSKGLLSDERLELLLSFRNSGFSVDTSPTVWPQDTQGLERLCRYLLRCPVSLSRIHWTPGGKTLFYESKQHANDDPLFSHPKGETLEIFEFIARVLTQIFPQENPPPSPPCLAPDSLLMSPLPHEATSPRSSWRIRSGTTRAGP